MPVADAQLCRTLDSAQAHPVLEGHGCLTGPTCQGTSHLLRQVLPGSCHELHEMHLSTMCTHIHLR